MQSNVLIFGVNGFVGPYLASEFHRSGYTVIGSDRASGGSSTDLAGYHAVDLLDADRVAEIIQKASPDHVINLAAISSVGQSWKMPQATMQTNIVGSLNILEGVKRLDNPARVLLIGSSEEYAPSSEPLSEESRIDATNPYGISKVTQEHLADLYSTQFDIPVYKVRAFNHTGVGQSPAFVIPSWCKQVAQIEMSGCEGVMAVGNTDVVRDFTDVRDIVRGYRLLLESPYAGQVFNLGSGRPSRLSDMLKTIISFSAQRIAVERDPGLMRPSDNPFIVCDNAKASEMLGWHPEHPMEDTLKEMFVDFVASDA